MAGKDKNVTPNDPAPEPTPPPAPGMGALMMPLLLLGAVVVGGATVGTTMMVAQENSQLAGTVVPGQQKKIDNGTIDGDSNGYPDAGKTVNGKYVSVYAYDMNGDWYWDLGDGRIQGSVSAIDDLDEATLTTCDYQVQYRGNFENNPFMDSGWIINNINCSGYDDNGQYNYVIVHETDPRYRGNPDWAVWGNWEYHTMTEQGKGNLTRPQKPVNN